MFLRPSKRSASYCLNKTVASRTVAGDVLSQGETDEPEEVEARTDAAFASLAARKAALEGAAAFLAEA